jgi:hypothetical protein
LQVAAGTGRFDTEEQGILQGRDTMIVPWEMETSMDKQRHSGSDVAPGFREVRRAALENKGLTLSGSTISVENKSRMSHPASYDGPVRSACPNWSRRYR